MQYNSDTNGTGESVHTSKVPVPCKSCSWGRKRLLDWCPHILIYGFHFFASCYSRAYKKWFWCYFSSGVWYNRLDLQKESDLTDLMMDAIKQGLEGLVVKDLQVIT